MIASPTQVCVYWPAMPRMFGILFVAWIGTFGTAAAEVQLTLVDGRITLKASEATVAEILAEWAKVGQTQIVNGEKIAGERISIELTNVTEGQALEVILRSVAGYIARQRPAEIANSSRFDRILILPASTTSAQPNVPVSTTPAPLPQYSEYRQYPSVPRNTDANSAVLETPNPSGIVGSPYRAYPPPSPASESPSPASIPGNSAPADSRGSTQVPAGASVPGMPVQQAPRNPPAYFSYPSQSPQR